jgi:hypothetical protein
VAELADAHDSKFEIYRFCRVLLRASNDSRNPINKGTEAHGLELMRLARQTFNVAQNVAQQMKGPTLPFSSACFLVCESLHANVLDSPSRSSQS